MSFLRGLPFIPYQTPKFSKEDQARMDDYNKQIEAYSKAVDDYNAYIEKWNAGPRTEDPTMQPPKELPFTQATLDTFSESAAKRARDTASQRELALAVAANPAQYGLSGFAFADGGEASKARLAYNKMFPQKFVVGGPAMAVQNAAAMMAPPAGAPAAEVSPSALQQFMNMITGETARREAETEAYLSQPVAQPATPRLDPAAYAEALRSVQESRISGGVIAPDADEREKTRREMERLSRPGGFAPAAPTEPTPGFQPPTIDIAPTSLPAAEQLKSLPGFKPVEQSPEDLIMRSEDDAENTLRFSDKRFKQLTSEHEADPFDYPSGMVSAGVAWVNPMDVVNATTYGKEEIDILRKEVAEQGPTDMDILEGDILPYINIEKTPSGDVKVTEQEGRHRMLRLADMGYTRVPVRFVNRNAESGETSLLDLPVSGQLAGKQKGSTSLPYENLVEITPQNRQLLKSEFGQPSNVDKIEVENGSLNVYTDIENQRDNRPLINDFLVKEDKRGQGIGTNLIKTTLEKYPNAGANASNEGAVKAMYRAGMRSQDYPRASEDALVEQVKENPVYMVANPKPQTYESDYFGGGVLEPEFANGGEVTNFIRKRAEGSPPSGELSDADRQTQLDIMRDMMLAEKVAAYLGPNNERGEFNPEEFYPHMLGRGNDYNVKVSPGGLASPSWNKEGSIPYTSLETGERTEYPIRPGTINTYGKDSYDPYVIAHEIDHDERHKWDVFAANMSPEQERDEEIRVRRNDLLYAPDQASWKRAVNNYYNFFNPGNEADFADKEDAVMKSLMYTANKYPEDVPESRQAEDTYWRTRHKELNPSLLDYIKSMLSK
jgi:hypothetical protein